MRNFNFKIRVFIYIYIIIQYNQCKSIYIENIYYLLESPAAREFSNVIFGYLADRNTCAIVVFA